MAIGYVVSCWLLIQVADIGLETVGAPDWVMKTIMLVLALGFPIVVFFSWAYEVTPEGIKHQSEVDRNQSIKHVTGRKLDRAIFVVLIISLAYFIWEARFAERQAEAPAPATPTAEPVVTVAQPDRQGKIVERKSIAVLPFVNRSANEEDVFFVDGMHDELLTQLTKIGSLDVISRTSVMEYRNTTKKIPEIAVELGVANVLEGGVQRAGNRVRINAQLIRADSDEHLWAESYDRELTVENLLDIQTEIARAIAAALQATLSPEEDHRLERRLTDDLTAYDAYLRAKSTERSFGLEEREQALADLEFALQRDPDFAAALAMYARTQLAVYWFEDPDPDRLALARTAIDQGRALDPELYELDVAEGYYYYWGFRDYDQARVLVERALAVAPGDADLVALLAFINRRDGEFEASLDGNRRVLELDPLRYTSYTSMAEIYYIVNDWDAAQQMVDRHLNADPASMYAHDVHAILLIERDADLNRAFELVGRWGAFDVLYAPLPWWIRNVQESYEAALEHADFGRFTETKFGIRPPGLQRGLTYLYAGDHENARREFEAVRRELEAARAEHPEDGRIHRALCLIYGGLGLQDKARVACETGMGLATWDAFEIGFVRTDVAKGLALAGLTDEALNMIDLYLSEPAGYGSVRTELEPAFRSLRDKPRFQELVEQFRNRKLQQLSFE